MNRVGTFADALDTEVLTTTLLHKRYHGDHAGVEDVASVVLARNQSAAAAALWALNGLPTTQRRTALTSKLAKVNKDSVFTKEI